MQSAYYKGKCLKRKLSKCKDVCRTYSEIGDKYALKLEENDDILEIRCNAPLEGLSIGEYLSDFVCKRRNGDLMVRECVQRKHLTKPMTLKLLDASREYWIRHGVVDWGVVIDEE